MRPTQPYNFRLVFPHRPSELQPQIYWEAISYFNRTGYPAAARQAPDWPDDRTFLYTPRPFGAPLSRGEFFVGLNGVEPLTSRLSGVRSNQLSYSPDNTVYCLLKTYESVSS